MTVKNGDPLPKANFTVMTQDGPEARTTDQIFQGRKVVLFGVPGAFTPLCDKQHLPGFLAHTDEFRARGIDAIAVTSVNDVFVMDAWAKSAGAEDKIVFLADGNGDFARAWAYTRSHHARTWAKVAALCDVCRQWRRAKIQHRDGHWQSRNFERGSPLEATVNLISHARRGKKADNRYQMPLQLAAHTRRMPVTAALKNT
jgi:peroxiredoxin